MRLFILGLCFIFFNREISSAINKIRCKQNVNNVIQPKKFEKCNKIERKLNFMSIDIDCQLMIIEMLQMSDLMSLADVNKRLYLLVEDILRRKFLKKTVIFRSSLYSPIVTIKNLEEYPDRIEAMHVLVVRKIVEKFGHIIRHLDVFHEYTIFKDVATDIFRAVNFYCADTLVELHISNWNDILAQFKKPFIKLEYLSLEGNFYQMANSNLNFKEIFPRIEHLSLRHLEYANATWLEYKYPYLKHVTVAVWNGYQPHHPLQMNDIALRKLFKSNPQIRSLTLKFPATGLLQMIAEKLPQLLSLEIEYFQSALVEENNKIKFISLKKLIVNRGPALANLILGNIEEFETNGLSREWVNVVRNEKNLKKLRINRLMDDSEVFDLANANTNLTEIYLQCGNDVRVGNLAKVMENNKDLMNFHIKTNPLEMPWNESNVKALLEKVSGRWIVTRIPFYVDLTRADLD